MPTDPSQPVYQRITNNLESPIKISSVANGISGTIGNDGQIQNHLLNPFSQNGSVASPVLHSPSGILTSNNNNTLLLKKPDYLEGVDITNA